MHKRRECKVQSGVQIICPYCGVLIEIPMCKAVNGEVIICRYCKKEFKFGM